MPYENESPKPWKTHKKLRSQFTQRFSELIDFPKLIIWKKLSKSVFYDLGA